MRNIIILTLHLVISCALNAQKFIQPPDTLKTDQMLPNVRVFTVGERVVDFLPKVDGARIFAAKKTSLVHLQQIAGNRASNNMRELLSRVPGIHIWESDAGGVQPGIASRGLSPNRSWEFNVRQNGFDIAADAYGYPEAYYNPPATAVMDLEITRGTAALQYGSQFGGMINYKTKTAECLKKNFDYELEQSFLSSQIINSFLGIGFKEKKYGGYFFLNHKSGEGWRENSQFKNNTFHLSFDYKLGAKLVLRPEITGFELVSQQPGGLTDDKLYSSPKQSLRSRNWMGISWMVPGVTILYQPDTSLLWETKLSSIFSQRNSVFFNQPINVPDTIVTSLSQYSNRLLQRDRYENLSMESRVKKVYGKKETQNVITMGIRYYNGNTRRLADGKGSTSVNYDIQVIGGYNKDIQFHSENFSVFSENLIRISNRIVLTMGSRMEWIKGSANGRNGYSAGNPIMLQALNKKRLFLLFGSGMEYRINKTNELYFSATECYRPILFSSLQSPPGNDMIDPELKDSKGFVLESGCRSKTKKNFTYDVSVYYIRYANKTGTLIKKRDSIDYKFLTNIGDSYSIGTEAFAEWKKIIYWRNKEIDFNVYLSYAFNESKYSRNIKDVTLRNRFVENAPRHILRSGLTIGLNSYFAGIQFNYTDRCYSDAVNTIQPSKNGQVGVIPSYAVLDINFGISLSPSVKIQSGINNLSDKKYFTRRSGGLPGPGALPADGRVFYFSFIKRM